MTIRGLKQFCNKYRIPIRKGDKFNLHELLLNISKQQPMLAEYQGRISEITSRLGEDSDEWGGCPDCGTNVHAGLSLCPICGLDLADDGGPDAVSDVEDEDEDADVEYEDDDEEEEYEDEVEEEPEAEDEEFVDEEEDEAEGGNSLEDFDEGDEEDEELEDEYEYSDEDEDDEEEYEGDDEEIEEGEDEEIEDEEESDIEPLSAARESVENRKLFKRKKENKKPNPRKKDLPYSEKQRIRDQIRKELTAEVPRMMKKPSKVDTLEYRKLLMMPGILGYEGKPATLGNTVEIRAWVKRQLVKKRKANATHK